MRVLQVTDSLAAGSGGTAAACAQLSTTLAESSIDVSLMTCSGSDPAGAWPLDPRIAEARCAPAGPRRLGWCPHFRRAAASLPRPDLVHIHGLWRLHYWQAARYARRLRVPAVVSVHGMLYRNALGERAALKRAARALFQDAVLDGAGCLHATAPEEVLEIRRAGFAGPVALIPWGVAIPEGPGGNGNGAGARNVLYLGRVHPRKGLDVLLRAWARADGRGSRLVVAGADPVGHRSELVTLAAELGIDASIEWRDVVTGESRERLFRDAAVLVLPSGFENFGLVVAEALARGIPVIATRGTPWASLAEERCGWWIPQSVDTLAAALSDALARSDDELRAMGQRGRRLVADRFGWERVAAAMRELYEWLLAGRPRPAFIQS
jgi:glycosyltransferase involved in cell wall biosynthesis